MDEQTIDGLAEAIYMTHRREPSPVWDNASDGVKEWVKAQARNALAYLRTLED